MNLEKEVGHKKNGPPEDSEWAVPKEDAPCEFTISRILDSGYTSDGVVQMREGTGLRILIVLNLETAVGRKTHV